MVRASHWSSEGYRLYSTHGFFVCLFFYRKGKEKSILNYCNRSTLLDARVPVQKLSVRKKSDEKGTSNASYWLWPSVFATISIHVQNNALIKILTIMQKTLSLFEKKTRIVALFTL